MMFEIIKNENEICEECLIRVCNTFSLNYYIFHIQLKEY